MMFKSLRRKLTGWYLSVLAIVLVGFCLGTYGMMQRMLLAGLDEANERTLAPTVGNFTRGDASFGDLAHELSEVALLPGEHLSLVTAKGICLYTRGPCPEPELPLKAGRWNDEQDPALRILSVPLGRHGVVMGYLRIGKSLDSTFRALRILGSAMAVLVPAALVLAWLGGSWVAGQAVKPVEAALEREKQLTRDVSHELRTPLSVIVAHLQLAREQPALPAPLRDKLDLVLDTARKMMAMVSDLLVLGRADVGIGERALRFSLGEILDEELEALGPLASARGITLEAQVPECEDAVLGDPATLARAVRNLIDNAIRYTPAGGSVTVRLVPSAKALHVSVSDTGPGVNATDRKRLFERFGRLEHGRATNAEGSGLGLAIARAIAQAHGGELTLASPPGQGATFVLRLPKAT